MASKATPRQGPTFTARLIVWTVALITVFGILGIVSVLMQPLQETSFYMIGIAITIIGMAFTLLAMAVRSGAFRQA